MEYVYLNHHVGLVQEIQSVFGLTATHLEELNVVFTDVVSLSIIQKINFYSTYYQQVNYDLQKVISLNAHMKPELQGNIDDDLAQNTNGRNLSLYEICDKFNNIPSYSKYIRITVEATEVLADQVHIDEIPVDSSGNPDNMVWFSTVFFAALKDYCDGDQICQFAKINYKIVERHIAFRVKPRGNTFSYFDASYDPPLGVILSLAE